MSDLCLVSYVSMNCLFLISQFLLPRLHWFDFRNLKPTVFKIASAAGEVINCNKYSCNSEETCPETGSSHTVLVLLEEVCHPWPKLGKSRAETSVPQLFKGVVPGGTFKIVGFAVGLRIP